jgi:hypothetical protein
VEVQRFKGSEVKRLKGSAVGSYLLQRLGIDSFSAFGTNGVTQLHRPRSRHMNSQWLTFKILTGCLVIFLFQGCATTAPPKRLDNVCEIFREHTDWYEDAADSYKRWGIPIPVMMAILHQESRYVSDAKPPRTTCLWIFPGPRPSSAYGYAQAKDETWEEYQENTGNSWADRDDFGDAIDFLGWYCHLSARQCGISKDNARNLYLAYHEGRGGFNRKTYAQKQWLVRVADKVQKRAVMYKSQLAACEGEFRAGGCCLWPF